jgi:hypothetical protein
MEKQACQGVGQQGDGPGTEMKSFSTAADVRGAMTN